MGDIITYDTFDQEESDEQEEKEKKKSITFKEKSSRSRRRLRRSHDYESTVFFFFNVIRLSSSSYPLCRLVIIATARADPHLHGVGERRCGPYI